MAVETFNISFSGETLPGADLDAAKQALASFFHFDTSVNIDAFFSGETVVLRRDLDKDSAAKIYVALRKRGIVTKIERERAAATPITEALDMPRPSVKPISEALMSPRREPDSPAPLAAPAEAEVEPAPATEPVAGPALARVAKAKAAKPKATKKPAAKAPTAKKPAEKKPAAKKPLAKKQATKKAATQNPVEKKPVAAKALAAKPAATGDKRPTPANAPAAQKKPTAPPKPAAGNGKAAAKVAAKPGKASAPAAKKTVAKKPAPAAPRPDPKRVVKAVPASKPAPAAPRKRRQPGAPNLFDVRLPESARAQAPQEDHIGHAARIGSIIMALAFIAVGLRFWAMSFHAPDYGLGSVAVDASDKPAVAVNDQLLWHDRAGNPGELAVAEGLALDPGVQLNFFADGKLLILRPPTDPGVPKWMHSTLDVTSSPGSLDVCNIRQATCDTLLAPLDGAALVVDWRTASLIVADVAGQRLLKLDRDGNVLASRQRDLTAPVSLELQEGILYLTQGDMRSIQVLKPDSADFGEPLDNIEIAAPGSPLAVRWLAGHWWVLSQVGDGRALFRFDDRWQFDRAAALPDGAHPGLPVVWTDKLLVPDAKASTVYRVAADAAVEKPFSEEAIGDTLTQRREQLEFAQSLRILVMLLLFLGAVGLMIFGSFKSLQGKIYRAKADQDESAFDINNEAIDWLDPAPNYGLRIQQLSYAVGGLAALSLIIALVARFPFGLIAAVALLLIGIGGYCYAIRLSTGCHLGRLGDQLVLVDHNSIYRVGRGPRIQYFNNFVMIDDVIVYLGNRLVHLFADEPLREHFEPIVTRGIKVDRTTLRLKLINTRHPLIYGAGGLLLSMAAAAVLLLVT